MGFVAPLFLLGGLLVALPIVLHLTRRRRKPVAFPSLLFLKRLGPAVRHRRRRIRNLPLLLLRIAALLLLALAFARPLLDSGAAADWADPPRDVALVVDRSLSMRIGDRGEAAREAAAEVLSGLGPADRAVVLAFDDRPEALTGLTEDRDELRRAVEGIQPGEAGTRIATALGLGARLVPAAPGRRREVVLISDLQRSGFEDGSPDRALPEGAAVTVVGVGSPPASWGASVSSVTLAPAGRDGLAAAARIGFVPGPSGERVEAEASLWLAGRAVERRTVVLEGARSLEAAAVRFAPFVRSAEPIAAEVRISGPRPDWLPDDDAFRFVVDPGDAVRVLHLGGGSSPLYLREALRVGASPAFLVEDGPVRGAPPLEGVRVVVAADPGRLDPAAVEALGAFVDAGGGLVLGMGPTRVRTGLEAVIPFAVGDAVERFPPGRIGNLRNRHPIFAPFSGGGGVTAALSGAAFFRYRSVSGAIPDGAALARFDDGRPALVAHERGAGRVATFLSSFDASWNDLPQRPAFVPLVHELLAWAARFEEVPIAWRVGQVVDPASAFRAEGAELLVRGPDGSASVLAEGAALRLDAAGRWGARPPEAEEFRAIAANPPLAELDPALLDAEEVRVAVAAPPPTEPEDGEPAPAVAAGLRLGWPLLLALALLLLSEGIVATGGFRRGSPAVPILTGKAS